MFILVSYLFTFLRPLFYLSCFIFRYNGLNIKRLERWNIVLQCFIFSFMFHFKFHVPFFKTLRERFIAPSVFLNLSHSVFKSLPQCFWISPTVFLNRSHSVFLKWNIETKSETLNPYVSSIEYVDNQQVEI